MLFAATGLIGRPVAARDGRIGSVKDILLDPALRQARWMVVDTGEWRPGRQVCPVSPTGCCPLPTIRPTWPAHLEAGPGTWTDA